MSHWDIPFVWELFVHDHDALWLSVLLRLRNTLTYLVSYLLTFKISDISKCRHRWDVCAGSSSSRTDYIITKSHITHLRSTEREHKIRINEVFRFARCEHFLQSLHEVRIHWNTTTRLLQSNSHAIMSSTTQEFLIWTGLDVYIIPYRFHLSAVP